ncbi:hypothetical protein EVAR_89782_1 [Eumeta japonica]|uniref:Uncharacterized protein n=1 Tax=Eumeta variegata TaxID=151549 RepID=A0A4C1XBA6_EUMVA|nr:hypothetical protein EVAR_89782_1 [Eumeta japonica]
MVQILEVENSTKFCHVASRHDQVLGTSIRARKRDERSPRAAVTSATAAPPAGRHVRVSLAKMLLCTVDGDYNAEESPPTNFSFRIVGMDLKPRREFGVVTNRRS